MSIWPTFVTNSIPYEQGPIQTLTCHYELLSILEASEQASGTCQQQRHMFEVQLPLDCWHCLI